MPRERINGYGVYIEYNFTGSLNNLSCIYKVRDRNGKYLEGGTHPAAKKKELIQTLRKKYSL